MINVIVLSVSSRFTHALFKDVCLNIKFFATFVYVYPYKSLQENMSDELLFLQMMRFGMLSRVLVLLKPQDWMVSMLAFIKSVGSW